MCDTILARFNTTSEKITLFGKNSDRQRNEAQIVDSVPAAVHEPADTLKCTYITIPEVARTHAVLLCRPFWIWGAEMGANEHGVVIGNEAVFAKTPSPERPALIGMDLLRLALERACTAAEAVDVVTTLLAKFGQGGNCGHLEPAYYNNAFMIADPTEAFVLETVDREWLVERVRGVRSLSNVYSIGAPERVSSDLHSITGDCPAGGQIAYAQALADAAHQHIGSAIARCERSTALLRVKEGRLGVADFMEILRDHGSEGLWEQGGGIRRTLCLHAGDETRFAQTVGAMVSELRSNGAVHWVTGTAATCLSVFKPLLLGVPVPDHGPQARDQFDAKTLWWRHELFHRAAMRGDLMRVLIEMGAERDELEYGFRARVSAVLNGGTVNDRGHVIAQCWEEALSVESCWYARLRPVLEREARVASSASLCWEHLNRICGLG